MPTSVSNSSSTTALPLSSARTRSFGLWESSFPAKLSALKAKLSSLDSEYEKLTKLGDLVSAKATLEERKRLESSSGARDLLQTEQTIADLNDEAKRTLTAAGLADLTGFPGGVTWLDARAMVAKIIEKREINSSDLKALVNSLKAAKLIEKGDPIPAELQSAAIELKSNPTKLDALYYTPPRSTSAEALALEKKTQEKAKAALLKSWPAEIAPLANGLPDGFPTNLDWVYLQKIISVPKVDGIELDQDLLAKTRLATARLAEAGITSIYPAWPPGTTVLEALEDALKLDKNNILSGAFTPKPDPQDPKKEKKLPAELSLTDFPTGLTRYQVFKFVEDSKKPGRIDSDKRTAEIAASKSLRDIGITNISTFVAKGTTAPSQILSQLQKNPQLVKQETPSKPVWVTPGPNDRLVLSGAVSGAAYREALVNHLAKFNPKYSLDEIRQRLGFKT